jgi:hypothetical protein
MEKNYEGSHQGERPSFRTDMKHLGRYKARGSYLVFIITPNVDSSQMFSHAISQLNFQVLNCETYLNSKW